MESVLLLEDIQISPTRLKQVYSDKAQRYLDRLGLNGLHSDLSVGNRISAAITSFLMGHLQSG